MVEDSFDIDLSEPSLDDEEIAEIIRRKSAYMEERKRSLGPEYYSAKDFWDRMWEMEWESLEERMKEPVAVQPEGELIPIEFPTLEVDGETLTLYTFEDFALLHNQGIFRDTKFLIDRRGKWTKNVVTEMETYGFKHKNTIIVSREKYLMMEVVE